MKPARAMKLEEISSCIHFPAICGLIRVCLRKYSVMILQRRDSPRARSHGLKFSDVVERGSITRRSDQSGRRSMMRR